MGGSSLQKACMAWIEKNLDLVEDLGMLPAELLENLIHYMMRIRKKGSRRLSEHNAAKLLRHRTLAHVDLDGFWLTDLPFQNVELPNLRSLQLKGTLHVGDASMQMVAARCTALMDLNMKGNALSDLALEALAAGCPLLQRIKVQSGNKQNVITDKGVSFLLKGCTQLRMLKLYRCQEVDAEAELLEALSVHANNLQIFSLAGSKRADHRLLLALSSLPRLQSLKLSKCSRLVIVETQKQEEREEGVDEERRTEGKQQTNEVEKDKEREKEEDLDKDQTTYFPSLKILKLVDCDKVSSLRFLLDTSCLKTTPAAAKSASPCSSSCSSSSLTIAFASALSPPAAITTAIIKPTEPKNNTKSFPSLRHISITRCNGINDAALLQILTWLQQHLVFANKEEKGILELNGLKSITNKSIDPLLGSFSTFLFNNENKEAHGNEENKRRMKNLNMTDLIVSKCRRLQQLNAALPTSLTKLDLSFTKLSSLPFLFLHEQNFHGVHFFLKRAASSVNHQDDEGEDTQTTAPTKQTEEEDKRKREEELRHQFPFLSFSPTASHPFIIYSHLLDINLSMTSINNPSLCCLIAKCPNVERLFLEDCNELTDFGVDFITPNLSRLRKLSLRKCYRIRCPVICSESLSFLGTVLFFFLSYAFFRFSLFSFSIFSSSE
ncbi:UV-damaged DNA-binding protein rad7 [Balamuthia mandrillaris]